MRRMHLLYHQQLNQSETIRKIQETYNETIQQQQTEKCEHNLE